MSISPERLEYINEQRETHEFLTFIVLKEEVRGGIVQNDTAKFIMIFDLNKITSPDSLKRFLKCGDKWWWERNQSIPIDAFIGSEFDEFLPTLTGFPKKALLQDPIGPAFSIEQYLRRVKKKKIDLVKRVRRI